VIDVDRGGKITWHGPGQLVIYPIVPLPQPLDVIAYVRALEQSVIETCANFGVTAQQVTGRSGVWHQPNPQISSPNKLCAIGVRVAQDTTLHGLALNCNNDLTPFTHITPCGISDAGVTTLSHAAGTTITPTMVSEPLTDRLVVNFKELGIH
jgi:lipoyl(octanoyl) transferase